MQAKRPGKVSGGQKKEAGPRDVQGTLKSSQLQPRILPHNGNFFDCSLQSRIHAQFGLLAEKSGTRQHNSFPCIPAPSEVRSKTPIDF